MKAHSYINDSRLQIEARSRRTIDKGLAKTRGSVHSAPKPNVLLKQGKRRLCR